ncbi:hypothetical protein [Streptomyces albipurpureus]|uniref:Uncharacterized protein n=1 Tax=Streptomyces albipurpureus TaxID=2897419 RepID=A0ABT0V3A1_9ACTN|nr:hypothetical protein [Streptomyces sp. CWNU-1]MCM2394375.1 hypothetical protein [Streptomyces sp. CWNU-1]
MAPNTPNPPDQEDPPAPDDALHDAETAITRTRATLRDYAAHGCTTVNIQQVLGLLSPAQPIYKDAPMTEPLTTEEPTSPPRLLIDLCEQHRPVVEPDPVARGTGRYLVSCKACDGNRQHPINARQPVPECRFWTMAKAYGYVQDATGEPSR